MYIDAGEAEPVAAVGASESNLALVQVDEVGEWCSLVEDDFIIGEFLLLDAEEQSGEGGAFEKDVLEVGVHLGVGVL